MMELDDAKEIIECLVKNELVYLMNTLGRKHPYDNFTVGNIEEAYSLIKNHYGDLFP